MRSVQVVKLSDESLPIGRRPQPDRKRQLVHGYPMTTVVTSTRPNRSDEQAGSFLDHLRRLVLDEALTAKQNLMELWSQPLASRVRQGRAIEGLRVVRVSQDGRIELACDRNQSRFREGDILNLNRHSPYFQPNFQVTLEIDNGQELTVYSRALAFNWGEVFGEPTGWILDQDQLDLSQYLLDALTHVGDTTVGRERILPLLMGRLRPQVDLASYERAHEASRRVWLER